MTEQWFTFPIINEICIEIGPIAIRWYALAYLAGIFTTMLLMNREAKKDSSAFEPEDITRLTNFCVIGIIIGGRLGFVLFYNFDFYVYQATSDVVSYANCTIFISTPRAEKNARKVCIFLLPW